MKLTTKLLLISFQVLLHINNISNALIRGKEHPFPMTLNVTYEFPVSDLTDRRRHANESFNYQSRLKEMEAKIEKDSQLLKMVLHTQNVQIQKMTEVYYLNEALLIHYLIDKEEKDKQKQLIEKLSNPKDSADAINKIIRLDDPPRLRKFLDGVKEAGMIGDSYKSMSDKEIFDNFKGILEKAIITSESKLSME